VLGQQKALAILSQGGKLFQIGAFWRRREKAEVQTTRVGHGIGKWIFRDSFGKCFESEDVNMRFEAAALVDLSGKLLGKTGQAHFGTLKHGVASLDIGPYLPCSDAIQGGNQCLHRKRIVATDIDAPEEGDVDIHSGWPRVHGPEYMLVRYVSRGERDVHLHFSASRLAKAYSIPGFRTEMSKT